MKKRILLIFVFVISLFMHNNSVSADVPMWMDCGTMSDFDLSIATQSNEEEAKEYYKYNKIATINGYNMKNSYAHKRVFYVGVKGDFFDVQGPVFMMNREYYRASPNDSNICWYDGSILNAYNPGETDDTSPITECDQDDKSMYLSSEKFYKAICPKVVYQVSGGDASGKTKGNFVTAIGEKTAVDAEWLKGYKFAFYKVNKLAHDIEGEHWIMEVYDDSGYYAFMILKSVKDACIESINYFRSLSGSDIDENKVNSDVVKDCSNNLNNIAGSNDFNSIMYYYYDIRVKGDKSGPLFVINNVAAPTVYLRDFGNGVGYDYENFYDFDSEFMDSIQAIQFLKLKGLGRTFFNLTDESHKALLANVNELDNSSFIDNTSDHLFYEANDKVWNISSEWGKKVTETLMEQYGLLSKFSDNSADGKPGEYYNFILEAQKASELISSGKKYSLPENTNIDDIVRDAQGSLNTLREAVSNTPKFPKYTIKDNSGEQLDDTSCHLENAGGHTNAADSLADYVLCKTANIDYNTLKSSDYIVTDIKLIIDVFGKTLSDQINKISGGSGVDLVNFDKIVKEYVINVSKYLAYIRKNYKDDFTEEQLKSISDLLNEYLGFARDSFGIEIIIDCDTLLGEDFINRISKYIDIIRIAIPIILIGFGIYDFISAVFANDDGKMKKAQQRFIMRVAIAVLFFLLPIFIKLILTIANKAWSFISPNSCNF